MDSNHTTRPHRRIVTVLLVVALFVATLPVGGAGPVAAQTTTDGQIPISELQSNTTSDGASAYAGQTVTVTGTVTAVSPDGFFVQNASASDVAYSGLFAYSGGSPDVSVGDTVEVTSLLKEHYGLTELDLTAESASVNVTGTGAVPEAVSLSTAEAGQEAYESVLVTVSGLTVSSTPGPYGEWAVTDGSGSLAVDDVDTGDSATPSTSGVSVDAVEGPIYYSFGAFKLQPKVITGLGGQTGDTGTDTTEITLVGYNDIGKAAAGARDDDLGRMITLIDQQRAESEGPVFVAGGGDEVSPHALRNYAGLENGYEPPVTALNLIDPDAEVVQNHELDYDEDAGTNDFEVFENISAESTYPWLLANVEKTSDGSNLPGTQDYTVVERDGVRVGYFGVTDGAIDSKTDGVVSRNGYEVTDPVVAAQNVTDTLRTEENVDVVVALAPLGIPDSKALARNVDGIDALISGDDQQRYPPQQTDGVLIAETSGRANAIATMTLTVDTANNTVTDASGELIDVTTDTPRNDTWKAYINPLRENYLDTPVVRAEMPEHTGVGSSYTDDTATGALLMDGVRNYTGADVAVTNAGGIRDTLYPSEYGAGEEFEITRGMVTSTLSFGNNIVVVEVTGAELREILRSQITPLEYDYQYGTQIQQQVAGVTFEWVPHTNSSSPGEGDGEIRDLTIDGEPVNDSATYTLATNSYIADGGSGYPLADKPRVKIYTDTTMAQGVLAYLSARERIDADEVDTERGDRMRRVDETLGANAVTRTETDTDTTLTVDVPARVTGVEDEAVLADRTGTRVTTTDVQLDGEARTVTVTVPASDFDAFGTDPLAAGSGVDLYVPYTDAEYSSQYENFDTAVLNVELDRDAPDGTPATPTVAVTDVTLESGDAAVVPITLSAAPDGFAGGTLTVSVSDPTVAEVEAASYPESLLSREPQITENDSSVTLAVADVEKEIQSGATDSALAELTLAANGTGTTTLTVVIDRFDDDNGTSMSVAAGRATVTAGPPMVDGVPPTDIDSDGAYEDLNGNGRLDYDDVTILFDNFEDAAINQNAVAYDFNGNGRVDYDDIVTLYHTV
ncbi:5'-nucleotidase C-terminal domain-containing protein [Haloplanus natans]|uniref:5'-nucleotidase C-terminal domain-containing protein n=1 Tax=Haloplanus natans TaxID=376171 RepID=UPI000A9338E5|nr:5'-nucleotidase C-terminal domain-containing protein [Haloplanus natans]